MDAPHLGQQVAVAVVEALQDRRHDRMSSRRLATSVVSRSRCIPMNSRVTSLRPSSDIAPILIFCTNRRHTGGSKAKPSAPALNTPTSRNTTVL